MSISSDLFSFNSSQKKQLGELLYTPEDTRATLMLLLGIPEEQVPNPMPLYYQLLLLMLGTGSLLAAPHADPQDGVSIWVDYSAGFPGVLKLASPP